MTVGSGGHVAARPVVEGPAGYAEQDHGEGDAGPDEEHRPVVGGLLSGGGGQRVEDRLVDGHHGGRLRRGRGRWRGGCRRVDGRRIHDGRQGHRGGDHGGGRG